MHSMAERTRLPIPVVLLIGLALTVVALLLAQAAIGFLLGIVRLVLILVAFACIAAIGLFLWRRGEVRDPGP